MPLAPLRLTSDLTPAFISIGSSSLSVIGPWSLRLVSKAAPLVLLPPAALPPLVPWPKVVSIERSPSNASLTVSSASDVVKSASGRAWSVTASTMLNFDQIYVTVWKRYYLDWMRLLHQKRLLVQHKRMKTFDQKAQRKNSLVLEGWNSDPEYCIQPDSLFVAGQLHSKQFLQFPGFPGDIFILFPYFYFITNQCCSNLIIVHIPSIVLCFPSTIVWLLNIWKAKKWEYYTHSIINLLFDLPLRGIHGVWHQLLEFGWRATCDANCWFANNDKMWCDINF